MSQNPTIWLRESEVGRHGQLLYCGGVLINQSLHSLQVNQGTKHHSLNTILSWQSSAAREDVSEITTNLHKTNVSKMSVLNDNWQGYSNDKVVEV